MTKENGNCDVCGGEGKDRNLLFSADCKACGGTGDWKDQHNRK